MEIETEVEGNSVLGAGDLDLQRRSRRNSTLLTQLFLYPLVIYRNICRLPAAVAILDCAVIAVLTTAPEDELEIVSHSAAKSVSHEPLESLELSAFRLQRVSRSAASILRLCRVPFVL